MLHTLNLEEEINLERICKTERLRACGRYYYRFRLALFRIAGNIIKNYLNHFAIKSLGTLQVANKV